MVKKEELKLTVLEAGRQADVGRGVARLPEQVMEKLNVEQYDVIEITGSKSTGAIVMNGFQDDYGLDVIRIDGLIRQNAGTTSIGEKVTVRRAEVKEAKSITIVPAESIEIKFTGEDVRPHLFNRVVVKDDFIIVSGNVPVKIPTPLGEMEVPFSLGEIGFVISDTNPTGIVVITESTNIKVLPEPVSVRKPVYYEDIGGLKAKLERVREMIELPLKHPEVFDRLGIEPPKGVLLHGPPGTGKTLIAKAVANESGANFTSINGPEIMCVAGDTQIIVDGQLKNAEEVFTSHRTSPLGNGPRHISFGATGKVIGVVNPSFTVQGMPLIETTQVSVPYYYNVELGTAGYDVSSNHPILVLTEAGLAWKTPPMLKSGEYAVGSVIKKLRPPEIEYPSKPGGIKIPNEFTPELAFLLGMLAGDGHISNDGITLCGKSLQLHEKFKQIVQSQFGIDKFSTYCDKDENVRTVVYSTTLRGFLNWLGFKTGKKDYAALLKRWLPRFDQRLYVSFVLGLLATDGTATPFSLILYSRDRAALDNIARIGRSRGIPIAGPVEHNTPLGKVWKTIISGKYTLREFGKVCGQLGDIGRLVSIPRPPRRSYEYVPPTLVALLKRALVDAGVKYGQDWTIEPYLNMRKRATLATVEKILGILKTSGVTSAQHADTINFAYRLVAGELWLDEICNVCKINKQTTMYDFGTLSNNFVTGYGHVMHNSKWYGESEARLREIFEQAEKNAPSIVFIDELDSVAPKREEVTGEVERRVVATLCTALDGLKSRGRVIVIGATNRPNALDPAIRRPGRFDREIEIGVPDRDGRKEVLQIHTRGMPLAKDVSLDHYANVTHGFVGADLEGLAKEAAMSALRRILPEIKLEEKIIPSEVLEKLQVTKEDFDGALRMAEPSAMREVLIEVPNVHWDDVGGLEQAKQELIEAVEWPMKYPDAFKRVGIEPPHGILLYGPPGTGKTMLARAVATESEANFISIKGPELLSKWVGESEKGVRETFRKARMAAPAIIFFDEIDALVPRRGSGFGDSHTTERVISQLLTELDGLEKLENVVVIGATNRPDLVDPALLRPGRFDRLVLVSAPDEKARLEIFKIHTKNMPLTKDVDLKLLAKETEGYSGSDIAALCREAAMLVLRKDIKGKEVRMQHFQEAMKEIRPSLAPETIKEYESFIERKSKSVTGEATRMHY